VIITSAAEIPQNINISEYLLFLEKQGFNRIESNGELKKIDELESLNEYKPGQEINIVIDRLIINHSADSFSRAADSAQTAFQTGKGYCQVVIPDEKGVRRESFSNKFEEDGILFQEPSEYLFSFNNPIGACPVCEGYGKIIGIDENLVYTQPESFCL